MLKTKIKQDRFYLIVLFGVMVVALIFYSYLPTSALFIFNSPDETANFFATESFSLYNSLGRQESLNDTVPGLVHPRSIVVRESYLLPVSFWGLPVIYGLAAKIIGLGFTPFIVPIFSACTILIFYLLLKKIFSSEIAFWSSLGLAWLPPYLYFSNRGFFHNVLFFDLLVLALVVMTWRPVEALGKYVLAKKKWIYAFGDDIWSSVCLGLAFWVRPAELIWVLPVLLAAALVWRKQLKKKNVIVGVVVFLAFLVAFLIVNRNLYGAWLGSGYLLARGKDIVSGGAALLAGESLLPFGLHPRLILGNIWHYFFGLWPALAWFYVIGAVFFAFRIYLRDLSRPEKFYFLSWLGTGAVLFTYYGSGVFNDSAEPGAVTPAISYFRYWLPVYAFGLPIALGWLLSALKIFSDLVGKITMTAVLTVYALISVLLVFETPGDGLLAVHREIISYRNIIAKAEALIPPGSLIIVHRADKIFFPQWPVALYDDSDAFFDNIAKLRAVRPVYYFRPGPTPQEQFDIRQKFAERNLSLKRLDIFGKDVLYEIK